MHRNNGAAAVACYTQNVCYTQLGYGTSLRHRCGTYSNTDTIYNWVGCTHCSCFVFCAINLQ